MSLRTRTALLVPALAAVTVLVLSACSGGTASAEPSAAATNNAPQRAQQQGGPGRGGASGQIASVTGTVMQLRSTDAQTAVTWTDTTTFTSEVAGALSDVTVGACVAAFAAPSTDSSASGSASSDDSTVAATSVRITEPADDGTCTPAFSGRFGGPGGGTRPNGAPTNAPRATRPSGAPSGAPGQFRMFGGGATGKVTAIDGDTLTVDSTGPDGTTTNRKVTVSSDTTYTRTVAADATAVVVGQCATARGQADDSGKVTATSVTVSAPTDGSCSSGFVFNGGGGPGGAGGRGGAGGPQGGTTDTQGGGSNA